MEIVRQQLGVAGYCEVLREVLKVRTDPESGRSWTPVQELICRCAFRAAVTTNYDPGIVDARMRVRPAASATGFLTWQDELGLDGWRTGDVLARSSCRCCTRTASTTSRTASCSPPPNTGARTRGSCRTSCGSWSTAATWCGSGSASPTSGSPRSCARSRNGSGTRIDPGPAPRHVAIMAWDPAAKGNDPRILARRAEISFGAKLILYPAPDGDHAALGALLSGLTDGRFPAAADLPARAGADAGASGRPRARPGDVQHTPIPVAWVPAPDPVGHFTGRAEELARLDRWAADPDVRLAGVTAWGGAGKTALVTHWVQDAAGAARRPGIRGVFGWSFYADPSAEHWAAELLGWAARTLGVRVAAARPAAAVLALLRAVPLVLVLDGLEVVQEGPAGDGYGQFLDGTLREVLAGACQQRHGSLILLTSRFPFTDLETFDGTTAPGCWRCRRSPPPRAPRCWPRPAATGCRTASAGCWWPRSTGTPWRSGHWPGCSPTGRRPVTSTALREDLAAAARTSDRVAEC